MLEPFCNNKRLIVPSGQSPRPVKRHRNKDIYVIMKTAPLQGRIGQKAEDRNQLRPPFLESQYHLLQAFRIDPAPRYPVEMNLSSLAGGAGAFHNGVPACLPPAPPAIITACTDQKLSPAVFAKTIMAFANVFAAVAANRRPQELIESLQSKTPGPFYFR
jgi:hypothetical protein